jgi:hypothetical protein
MTSKLEHSLSSESSSIVKIHKIVNAQLLFKQRTINNGNSNVKDLSFCNPLPFNLVFNLRRSQSVTISIALQVDEDEPFNLVFNLRRSQSVTISIALQVDEDEPLFLSLIGDLFPGIQLDNATYDDLQLAIGNQVDAIKLVNHPAWNLKLVQVSVALELRRLVVWALVSSYL